MWQSTLGLMSFFFLFFFSFKVSIFHLLVRSLINTVSMGSVCVEQMAQASLGKMKNANLSNAAKTTWLEISLGGGLNSHLKTHLAGTHTFLLSSALCTILILLYLSSSHSALSVSAPPGGRCLLFPLLNMLCGYDGMILYSVCFVHVFVQSSKADLISLANSFGSFNI